MPPVYTIHPLPGTPHTEVVPLGDAAARIDELSGRSIARYILGRAIPDNRRRTGRASAYVATDRNSPGRELYGRGFVVQHHESAGDLLDGPSAEQ